MSELKSLKIFRYLKKLSARLKESDKVKKLAVVGDWFIDILILLNVVAACLMTYPNIMAQYGTSLNLFCDISIIIFIIEILIRIWFNDGKNFFYKDKQVQWWNVFDTSISVITAMSLSSSFIGARSIRMIRQVRLLRTLSINSQLESLTEALIKSLPGIFWSGWYLAILFFFYALMGIDFYRDAFPQFFETLGTTLFTLFQLMTLEGWNAIANEVCAVFPHAWIYFVTFIIMASYILLNLIVGIIVDTLSNVREENQKVSNEDIKKKIDTLSEQLEEVKKLLKKDNE